MPLQDSCSEISTAIKLGKTAIFCGAGISCNSGLPIVSELLNYLFAKLEMSQDEQKLIINSDLPFESIMEKVLHESGLNEIMAIFEMGTPNANHFFIAKLVKEGYLKTICTTNFDILIERALQTEGLIEGQDYCVYSSEAELNKIDWDSPIIKLIKIHGCATKKEDIVITMSTIASNRYSEMRKNVMQAIYGSTRYDNILVMGYSCSDLDLTPLIESVEGARARIHFIDHLVPPPTGDADLSRQEPVSSKAVKNPFKHYTGTRHFVNTDDLIKHIWITLLSSEHSVCEIAPGNWKQNIDDWYLNSVDESGEGVKHHIVSRLLYTIAEFNRAIEHHKKAVAIAFRNNNLRAYAAETGNLGIALSAIGSYEQAEFCLNESIPLCRLNDITDNLSSQLQALATLLHRKGDDINAIATHKEALKYAEINKDENSVSTILGEISNSYNRTGNLKEAYQSLQKALLLSRKLGNKQAESSQLGILAYTYFQQGDEQKAFDCLLTAIAIKKTIADKNGESILLFNLSCLYLQTGKLTEARETIAQCIALAKEIYNHDIISRSNSILPYL